MKLRRILLSGILAGMLGILAMGTGFAESDYRIVKDERGEYTYNEEGYCIQAYLYGASGPLDFAYDFDDEGRVIRRNYVDGNGNVLEVENYTYNEAGGLEKIWCLDPITGEPEWTYDERGRGVHAKNYYPTDVANASINDFSEVEAQWDENNRLTQLVSYSAGSREDAAKLFVTRNTREEDKRLFEKRAMEYAGIEAYEIMLDGRYVFRHQDVTLEYDEKGRLTNFYEHLYDTDFYNYILKEEDHYSHTFNTYWFDYNDPEKIVIWVDIQHLENDSDLAMFDPIMNDVKITELKIEYNDKHLPIKVGEIDTDIYDLLDCTVREAEVGYFGYFWNDTFYNNVGELHGGIAGLEMDPVGMKTGEVFTLKVTGTNAKGEEVIYYMQPDSIGCRLVQKFTDGRYTDIPSTEMNLRESFTLNLKEDRDTRVYEKILGTQTASVPTASKIPEQTEIHAEPDRPAETEPQEEPAPKEVPDMPEQKEEVQEQDGWTCIRCGNRNTGNFCTDCGEKKPVQEKPPQAAWKCPSCGKENEGNFCSECGQKRPEQSLWLCSECGNENEGKFCTNCGSPKPQEELRQRQ